MRRRFACLLASACIALWPALGTASTTTGAPALLKASFETVVVGYQYRVSGANFLSIKLPGADLVPYTEVYMLAVGDQEIALRPGEIYSFGPAVDFFYLHNINPKLGLDPHDPAAFPVVIELTDFSEEGLSVKTEPLLADFDPSSPVPLPTSVLLLLAGVGALAALRRRAAA